MTIIAAESAPPHHLVRRLGDENGPFVGSWTYEISPADAGSKIVLTEVAEFKKSAHSHDDANLWADEIHG
jgi:hypothetical protein